MPGEDRNGYRSRQVSSFDAPTTVQRHVREIADSPGRGFRGWRYLAVASGIFISGGISHRSALADLSEMRHLSMGEVPFCDVQLRHDTHVHTSTHLYTHTHSHIYKHTRICFNKPIRFGLCRDARKFMEIIFLYILFYCRCILS